MSEKEIIDDLIKELDAQFSKGAGHVNVEIKDSKVQIETLIKEKDEDRLFKEVKVVDCGLEPKDVACKTPTLMEGLDWKGEDENE